MAEFTSNNAKHASTEYMSLELNCRCHPRIFYKDDVVPRSKSKVADKLTKELRNLMAAYKENLQHAQELQKRA